MGEVDEHWGPRGRRSTLRPRYYGDRNRTGVRKSNFAPPLMAVGHSVPDVHSKLDEPFILNQISSSGTRRASSLLIASTSSVTAPCKRRRIGPVGLLFDSFDNHTTRLRQCDSLVPDMPAVYNLIPSRGCTVCVTQGRHVCQGLNFAPGGPQLIFRNETWSN